MRLERPLAALLLGWVLLGVACGGGGEGEPGAGEGQAGQETAAVDTDTSPVLAMPVSRFALSLADLPEGYLTDRQSTFELTIENYGGTKIFPNAEEGRAMLEEWGYLGGYETAFEPEQRMTGVLNGRYYAAVEVHLFKSAAGARKAQEYFESRLARASDQITAGPVGNESSAWKVTRDTIPGSNIAAAYHRVVFRRGNLLAVVQTYGSDVLMTIDTARDLALIVDEKALGVRPAVTPTPLGEPGTPTPTP